MTHGPPVPARTAVPSRPALAAAFAAIYLIWGATFLAIRYAVAEVPPLLSIGVRCAFGALLLTAWCALRGDLARTTAAQWRVAGIAAVLLFLGSHGILAWAEQEVSSGQAALLMTTIPLWMVLIDALQTRRMPAPRVLTGLAVGVAGVLVLTGRVDLEPGASLQHAALLVGALCWASGSLVARSGPRPASAVQSTAMQLGAGAVAVGLASLAAGELSGFSPSAIGPRAVGALIFLVLFGTTVAFAAYTWLLQVATPAAVGTYAFVNPVVAVILAWGVGDETASLRTGVAAVLVVTAVVLARGRPAPRRGAMP